MWPFYINDLEWPGKQEYAFFLLIALDGHHPQSAVNRKNLKNDIEPWLNLNKLSLTRKRDFCIIDVYSSAEKSMASLLTAAPTRKTKEMR